MQNIDDKAKMTYAGFWPRLAAFGIDSIIVFGLQCILTWFTSDVTIGLEEMQFDGLLLAAYAAEDVLLYAVRAVYFILFTYITGTTLGKRAMNLRVINKDGSTCLSLMNIIYRETVGKFLCKMTVGIGYLIIGFDPDKRGLHDMLCDTQVIYAKNVKVYKEVQDAPARRQAASLGYRLKTDEEDGNRIQKEAALAAEDKQEENEVLEGYHLTDEPKVDIVVEENVYEKEF